MAERPGAVPGRRACAGAGSGIDLDRLDGREAAEFVRTSAQAKALLGAADGAGSGVDADRLDGLDSGAFARAGGAVTVGANLRANGQLAVGQPSLLALSGNAGAPSECNLRHVKQAAATRVRVTYQDNLGYHMNGGHSWGCRWRLVVDGQQQGGLYSSHTSPGRGWRIDPHRLVWTVEGLGAGSHSYSVQVDRPNSSSASECLAGYPDGGAESYLMVEEVR